MRTTLDIDPVVLSAARAKARHDGISLGRAVSALALEGMRAEAGETSGAGAFPVLHGAPEHRITSELVDEHRDD